MKVSIITVCLNAKKSLEETIQSILSQKNASIEYIIIDGGSTDGTVDIIKRYSNRIDYWHSQRDNGIYDAMNIGIEKATGDLIYFLNADDYLFHIDVIEKVLSEYVLHNFPDMIYGKIVYMNDNIGRSFVKSGVMSKTSQRKGQIPPHQAIFMRSNVFEILNGFDLQYRSASDVDLIIRYSLLNKKSVSIEAIIAVFRLGGYSSNRKENYSDLKKIIKKYYGRFWMSLFYIRRCIIERLIKMLVVRMGLLLLWNKFYFFYNNNGKGRVQ